jgi:predicted nucleotidyltransferase
MPKDASPATPFPDLNMVLQELVVGIQVALGSSFVAACLQGSFALGDFDRHSDVDFIVAVHENLSADQVQDLQAMHARLYQLDCSWAQHLEGSYFPKDVLKDYSRCGELLWYLDHGSQSLVRSDHCNTVVVRWTVRERGVSLTGPPPSTLVDPIPVDVLQREILDTLRGWGQAILADPQPYENRFYQTFIILNYCRMLHDLLNGFPGSKRAGADWAQANLDPAWSSLIERAWDGRPDPARSVRQPADPEDFKRTLQFVQYIIDASTQVAANLGIE